MISILILTLNEENNMPDCLASVAWSDDIVVLDSGSRDKTIPLAKKQGARIAKRPFDNWAAHQNWAIENVRFKNPWVFYLDADERMTPELKDEILAIANNPSLKEVGYFCGRKNYLWGKWIKHAFPPSLIFRFFKPGYVKFKEVGHAPSPVIKGAHGYLKNYFEHYNFSKGLEEWFAKHNRYSSLEAREGVKTMSEPWKGTDLVSGDPFVRRRALKALSYRIPCKPLLKFIYLYFFKCGFLDGKPGLIYCFLQIIYEYMIVVKMRELLLRGKGLRP
ncbi:MAG TPA: glycosyltransferase family 2 protein [bacterium]|nr:glycosyltransferase family 2 protein [bacterium]